MNITRIIINRLLFRFAPIIALFIFIFFYEGITFDNIFNKLGFLHCILIALFVYYSYDLIKHFHKAILRKKILQQAKLEGIPADIDLPRKLNFLDKRFSINEISIEVSLNNDVIFHLSTAKKQIEIKKCFGKKILSFHEIKFIFIEYNQYEKDTVIDFFSSGSTYDKNVWNISIMAMLKNGRQTKLFDAKLEETNYEQMLDYQISGKYEEKSYLEHGKNIIRLFSLYMNKKYLIVNNTV